MNAATDAPDLVPFPQQIVSQSTQMWIDSTNFKFITKTKQKCEILENAIQRYRKLSFITDCSNLESDSHESKTSEEYIEAESHDFISQEYLSNVTIEVRDNCSDPWPQPDMDEMHTIRVDTQDFPKQAFIFSNSVWGALRALETLSQLIVHKSDTLFAINSTFILDYPRFSHRGLLIDTSRHFLPVRTIHDHLDAMAYHKMNVFHWHIVDDQSFPYVSQTFPDLSSKGSYNSRTHVYNSEDIESVIEFARSRGIRVLVEFDTPGHTLSWGKAFPQLLTECYSKGKPDGMYGPLNPSQNLTFDFLEALFKEVSTKFNDPYIHLGGDEVNNLCWKTNPQIQEFMKAMKMSGDYSKLEEFYFERLSEIISSLNKQSVVWQEVFDADIRLPNTSIVNVWKGQFERELQNVTGRGFRAVLSSCWYLNKISYGYDWFTYYNCDPHQFNGSEHQKSLVIGGEASMWGEWVDASNSLTRTWFDSTLLFLIINYVLKAPRNGRCGEALELQE